MNTRVIEILSVLGLLLTGCDTRKDIVPDLEKNASTAPSIQIRRHNSGQAYVNDLSDTTLINASGYRLDFVVSSNADLSTMDLQCVSGCANVSYTQVKKDSNLIVLFIGNGKSAGFLLTVKNKFGQATAANFSLVTINQKPVLRIRNYNFSFPFALLLNDTIKTSVNPVYNLEFQLMDDNTDYSSVVVKRVTAGDNHPYSVSSSRIDFNYSLLTGENNYAYKIYVTDPLGVTSDTCYLKLNVFFNKAPGFVALASASLQGNPVQASDNYLSKYLSGSAPFWCYPAAITIKAMDKDQSQGGYIKRIRWRVRYNNSGNMNIFDETFVTNYTAQADMFTLNYYSPIYKTGCWWGSANSRVGLDGTLIDNNNDSVSFSQTITY